MSPFTLQTLWTSGNTKAITFLTSISFDFTGVMPFSRNENVRNPFNDKHEFESLTDAILCQELHYQYFDENPTSFIG